MKFQGKWQPDSEAFRKECLQIANNINGKWANFKRNPIYCRYINNDNRDWATGIAFYAYIAENYPHILARIDEFKVNDRIGNPTLHKIQGHTISPGTLRFMKVVGDVEKAFKIGFDYGEVDTIVEIGSGYGGQALAFKIFSNETDYSVIDLPESLYVLAAYLKSVDENVYEDVAQMGSDKFYETTNPSSGVYHVIAEKDLCISDYCLSELDYAGQDFYIENVIKHCKYGYFTINNPAGNKYLIQRLGEYFKLEITPEFPKTSKHENQIVYAWRKRDNGDIGSVG